MATYTVTTANWNDGAFWASVGPADPGNLLDFSGLPSTYSVTYNYATGEIIISDGATTYTIGDANATGGPYDTTLGGTAELNFFDFLGSQGDDTVIGDANANAIDGSGGIDEVDYSGSGGGVNVDLGTGTGSGGDAAGDTYANIENVTGSAYDDTLTGDAGGNVLTGGTGSDTVSGGGGNDTFADSDPGSFWQDYQAQTADLGTVAHWSFDETSGTVATDSVGTNNATYLTNTDPNQPGMNANSGVYLNGTNSSNGNGYVEVANDPSMQLAEGTFHLWINPDDVTGTQYIFDMYDGNGAQEGLRLYIQNGVLYASITDNYSTQTINTGVSVVDAGSWQHVGVSFGNGSLSIFHNGIEVATVASTLDLTGNTEELWIGARQDGSWNEDHFHGYVDEFAIHDSALTEAQMADLFAAGPTGGSLVVEADTYDGGAGTDEVDYSGSTEAVNVNLATGAGSGGSAEGDSYTSVENVTGSAFNDTLTGDGGANALDGGGGADTITGGGGDDTVTGGAGDDVYVLQDGFGNDRILDFDTGDDNFDGIFNDQLDLTGLTDALGNPVNVWDVTVTDDGSGNALLTFPNGETLVLIGVAPTSIDEASELNSAGVVCYAPGTLIDTPDGPRAVETLRPGDLVLTMDHGPQPIRWVRSSDHPLEEAEVDDKPVLIAAGALGNSLPAQDLIVSPQHRILVGGGGQLTRYFNTKAFAPAKALTKLAGIRHMKGKARITWLHFACDRHEVVTANGCLSESLLLGPVVVNGLTAAERRTLTKIFGPVTGPGIAFNGPAAFACLTVGEARRQIANSATAKHSAAAKEICKWNRDAAMERYDVERLRDVASAN